MCRRSFLATFMVAFVRPWRAMTGRRRPLTTRGTFQGFYDAIETLPMCYLCEEPIFAGEAVWKQGGPHQRCIPTEQYRFFAQARCDA